MNRADYSRLRGWDLPADENGADDGYLVEYTDSAGGNVPGYEGYVSWSPAPEFERAYRQINADQPNLTFSNAAWLLPSGYKLAREGWNGKGMFIFAVSVWRFEHAELGVVPVEPFIAMKTAQNTIIPWLASQADQSATDWRVIL